MDEASVRTETRDREHLKLLEIFYYIAGGSKALFALFPLLYMGMGVFFILLSSHMPARSAADAPPAIVGWLMVAFGGLLSLVIGALAAVQLYAGLCIHRRRRRAFCLVAAAVSCLNMPWGLALGVFTFLVLSRDSVATLFSDGERARAA